MLATAAAVGESTPIGKRAQLTSILWMMSNLGPSTWSSDLCRGPLGHDGGVCNSYLAGRSQDSDKHPTVDRTVPLQ